MQKQLKDLSVVELKAYLFDLQGHIQDAQNILLTKIREEQSPLPETKKEEVKE